MKLGQSSKRSLSFFKKQYIHSSLRKSSKRTIGDATKTGLTTKERKKMRLCPDSLSSHISTEQFVLQQDQIPSHMFEGFFHKLLRGH